MALYDLSSGDCLEARRCFSWYVDNELPAAEEELLERHLMTCAGCSAWAADINGIVSTLRGESLARPGRDLVIQPQRHSLSGVAAACAAVAAAAVAVLSVQVDSRAVPKRPLSLIVVQRQLALKERQLEAIAVTSADVASREHTRIRPSLPAGTMQLYG